MLNLVFEEPLFGKEDFCENLFQRIPGMYNSVKWVFEFFLKCFRIESDFDEKNKNKIFSATIEFWQFSFSLVRVREIALLVASRSLRRSHAHVAPSDVIKTQTLASDIPTTTTPTSATTLITETTILTSSFTIESDFDSNSFRPRKVHQKLKWVNFYDI